jgi:hypothetical protein
MPIDEILSPYYVRGKVQTGASEHAFIYYLDDSVFQDIDGDWAVVMTPDTIKIRTIVASIYNRINTLHGGHTTEITSLELWQSATGANVFVDYIAPDVLTAPTASPIASAYRMWVFATADRRKARVTSWESNASSPQRYGGYAIPSADDGSLPWLFVNLNSPFRQQDGGKLSALISANDGYNRKLARSYGRSVAP